MEPLEVMLRQLPEDRMPTRQECREAGFTSDQAFSMQKATATLWGIVGRQRRWEAGDEQA